MKAKSYLFTLFAILFSIQATVSQVKSNFCQTLQTIIKEAENGTFINFRGAKWKESEIYDSNISFASGRAFLSWDKEKGWKFNENPSYEDEDFDPYYNAIKSCLPASEWAVCDESGRENIRWVFKNLKKRVFVSIDTYLGVSIKVYLQKESTSKCLWGDCQNGYGYFKFENDDYYRGDFINGFRTGVGVYTWAATGQYYDGYWLNGYMNGLGTIYKSDSTVIRDGIMYQSQWLDVDVNKTKNFTKDETKNGFGMVYDNGKYQICTHKEGKPSGISLVDNENTVFGNYQNGFTGFCIVYYTDGSSLYGNFENGSVKGKGLKYLSDGTKFEGYFDTNFAKGSKFDINDFLIQKETWQDGKLTVDNSTTAQSLVRFAKSLSYLTLTGAEKLKGKEIETGLLKNYSSKYKLIDALKTEITVDYKSFNLEIESQMNVSKLNKTQALIQYNALIEKVKNCITSSWKGEETENKDDNNSLFRVYKFSNSMYYYSFEIKCWFNDLYLSVL